MPEFPISPRAPGALGHGTVVLKATVLPQPLGSASERKEVNRNVSPLLSDRCRVTMGRLGSVTPGLMAVIDASFQLVTLPWKMLESSLPVNFRCAVTPGML